MPRSFGPNQIVWNGPPLDGSFILRCCGGLGNHLNPLYSSIEYCNRSKRRLIVHSRTKTKLTDIWDGPFEDYDNPSKPLPEGPRFMVGLREGRKLAHANDEKIICYSSFSPLRFIPSPNDMPLGVPEMPGAQWGSRLSLKSHVKQRVDEVLAQLPTGVPLVGINIRRVRAHPATRSTSPVSWFVRKMRYIQNVIPQVHFYISVDAPQDEHKLRQLFGDRITAQRKGYDYDSSQGIIEATVDLYLLGSTHHVVYPYGSSFAPHAAHLQPPGKAPSMERPKGQIVPNDHLRSLAVE